MLQANIPKPFPTTERLSGKNRPVRCHYAGRADAEYALKQYERTVANYKKAIELETCKSSYYANWRRIHAVLQ